jgi:predicted negative regulator of RcsB-dependent stress response
VDEYLSDKEQVERLRAWWRENGWFLIGGVAIGLLAIYGYRQYFSYQDRQAETAGALYAAVKEAVDGDDTATAETRFGELKAEYPDNVYTHQAALLLASAEVVTAPDAARTSYLEAMVASGAELLDRSFLQMKLADLPGAAPDAASEAPPESGEPAEAPAAGAAAAPAQEEGA